MYKELLDPPDAIVVEEIHKPTEMGLEALFKAFTVFTAA